MFFYSDKLRPYTTNDFGKFFIPDVFKHVRLQNTFNMSKVHQILPLIFDYACFLVKCINYQNVMCIQKFYSLQESCKLGNFAIMPLHPRILQELNFFVRTLQDFLNVQETCKILQETNFLSTTVLTKKRERFNYSQKLQTSANFREKILACEKFS